jgi:quercetin dioxygenase-like cupin family protein
MNARRTLTLLTLCTLPWLAPTAHAAEAEGIQVETILQSTTSWDGTAYPAYPTGQTELTVLKITIAPHTTLPWHTHPMPNAAYVQSGELTVEKAEGGETRKLVSGDVLPEMVNSSHRGYTGDQPVVLIVFYAGEKRMPLSKKVY